jgi:ferric-dicitrate binding protein FerR (iron transport regulator)
MRAIRSIRVFCQLLKPGAVRLALILSVSLLLLEGFMPVLAQNALLGTAQTAIGTLVVIRPDRIEDRLQGQGAIQLYEGDVLQTEAASQALIEIKEGIELALNENTTLKLLYRWEKVKGVTQILRLKQGEIWVKTGPGPKQLEVETPVATAAVRETEFNIKVQDDGETTLTVMQGTVEFGTAFGTCPIRTATISYGVRGKRCTKPQPVDVQPARAWLQTLGK